LIDEDSVASQADLRRRYPGIERAVDLVPDAPALASHDFARGDFLWNDDRTPRVSRVYVCLDDEARTVSATLLLLRHLRGANVPVGVRLNQEAGLGSLLGTVKGRPGFEHVHVFGLLEHACQPDLVMGGENEVLARALHDEYVRNQRAQGDGGHDNRALVPWSELPPDLRESNRTEADHIAAKLETIGCHIGPLADIEAAPLALDEDEVERLAVMEHERWLAERRNAGWTLGPRDPQRRTNPNLKPWAELDAAARATNRELVRRIPALLARAGLAVHRHVA
jgi:hypothetical protein